MEQNQTKVVTNTTLYHANQNITGKESKLLLRSSNSSGLDQGSVSVTPSKMGEAKKCSDAKWYCMFLLNKDMRRFIEIFSGKRSYFVFVDSENSAKSLKIEKHCCFKIFSYTAADHKRRFEKCAYNKEAYAARRDAAYAVKEAFLEDSVEKLNNLSEPDSIKGNGYLFVCAPLEQLLEVLKNIEPRHYLMTNYKTHIPLVIDSKEMEEFIYLYESMPYNIELMDRPLEFYMKQKRRIRITAGVFAGKEGCIMRLHRNTRLVFAFGTMTIAINYLHAFPFEVIE